MASGGFRSHTPSSSNTTDFLEEWKAKREKMRAKMFAAENMGTAGATEVVTKTGSEMNNNNSSSSANVANSSSQASVVPSGLKASAIRRTDEEQPVSSSVGQQRKAPGPVQDGVTGEATQEELPPPASPDPPSKTKEKAKSCSGPSARKGKGQIEKRKLREKRRSTGVVNIPSTESPEDEEDDESGQKERKRADAVTQQNTLQNESLSIDPNDFLQSERNLPNRYKSTNNAPDDDVLNRHSRSDRTTCNRFSKDAAPSQGNSIEKKIEELEKELARERQENLRLVKIMQDKEELILKMKEEIDLLNRDLDDIEDENKQLKQENKTLLKVVGQLTR
ncbi:PRKC apoptosis WT1 regulator protein [Hyla sarda]|uniref:PRKC apoptosis WT1 regulator protein n=1 Tax=Hyla sarda TaxID=327740 RepID=UPI0024C3987E|nr:PRKC apoptosis WT1 regulator protein [Hyla sarda]XP_056430019.1 PRKC apoptosis WT1 regulator protein [Hyla sarda]XP_056430020.1 PRKC apoptosis WT1 regulator protein [Hyla sarda]XP_056430021.1 PRKC apoptosis WT1 regulator protein [Hyla sarda]XP_056430023.1 PRKC apoptosis WT1 regulator protein [Hyla sarda]XP_056430024.1 PRKC apoptosis WT1 regulator protein [Hyla sarda]